MLKKEGWSELQYNSVHWGAIDFATTKLPLHVQIRLSKFVYNWLPIGERRQSIQPTASTLCPSCENTTETTDHLLSCMDVVRREHRDDYMLELDNHLKEIRTPAPLATILSTAIPAAANDPDYQHPELTGNTARTRLLNIAIRHQNSIGWRQAFKGRIVREFQLYVNSVLYNRPVNTHLQRSWTSDLILWLWNFFEEQWDLRNKAIHGDSPEEQRAKVHQRLQARARKLYEHKPNLSYRDQQMLSRPLESVLKYSATLLYNWLAITEPAIQKCINNTPTAAASSP